MWKYIGNGSFQVGLPARDLTDAEAQQLGYRRVLRSGLYLKPAKQQGEQHARDKSTKKGATRSRNDSRD